MDLQYHPLKPEEQEIRLFTISPDWKMGCPIQGCLQTVSLKRAPNFEALSYVWGVDDATEPITVDGTTFRVTPNLKEALHLLRHSYRQRVMWIDYICINQNDLKEKNSQVPLMGLIYTEANRVISVLGGEPSLEVTRAVTWTERYIQRKINKRTLFWWLLDIRSLFSERARQLKYNAEADAFLGHTQIPRMPYWGRMWTFQEYHLPKQEPTCICGFLSFRCSIIADEEKQRLMHALKDALLRTITSDSSSDLLLIKRNFDEDALKDSMQDCWDILSRESLESPRLAHLLMKTSDRQCGNPLDKIYALYGLVPSIQQMYPPDYKKPLAHVILETTGYIIAHESVRCLFMYYPSREDTLSNRALPSWVPDYSKSRSASEVHRTFSLIDRDGSLKASPAECEIRVSPDQQLHLRARAVGACKSLFRFDQKMRGMLDQIHKIFKMTDESWRAFCDRSVSRTRFFDACVYHRNILGMLDRQKVNKTVHDIADFLDSYKESLAFEKEDVPLGDLLAITLHFMSNQTVFLTQKSPFCSFGMSPVRIEEEDLLVVPGDVIWPLVLRRVPDESEDNRAQYKLVCKVYLDGLVTEEGEERSPFCTWLGQQPLEEFILV